MFMLKQLVGRIVVMIWYFSFGRPAQNRSSENILSQLWNEKEWNKQKNNSSAAKSPYVLFFFLLVWRMTWNDVDNRLKSGFLFVIRHRSKWNKNQKKSDCVSTFCVAKQSNVMTLTKSLTSKQSQLLILFRFLPWNHVKMNVTIVHVLIG